MKVLLRIAIFLAAALVVVGVAYAISRSDLAQARLAEQSAAGEHGYQGGRAGADDTRPRRRDLGGANADRDRQQLEREYEHRSITAAPLSSESLQRIGNVLLRMAIVVAAVTIVRKGIKLLRRRARA
jgi:opacity protein-like surface antigen